LKRGHLGEPDGDNSDYQPLKFGCCLSLPVWLFLADRLRRERFAPATLLGVRDPSSALNTG
jgi:hypothetical protein